MNNIESLGLEVRPCNKEDIESVLTLEAVVLSHLEQPEMLRRNTKKMWQSCLMPPHVCLGAWDGEHLVALAILYVPQEDDDEVLAPMLQTVNAEGHRAANYKICLVHPDWRGHHLQILLGQRLHDEARRMGIDLLCSTASPLNIASIRSLQKLGYHADHKVQKYGFERIVFFYFN